MSARARSAGYVPSLDLSCLQVHYQPQVSVRSGRVVAVEALLCYDDPLYGRIDTREVLRGAEQAAMLEEVTTDLLTQALTQAGAWRSRDARHLHISINLAGMQLRDRHLSTRIADALAGCAVPPLLLELEISELEASMLASPSLEALRALGVHLTIDDFSGTRVTPSVLKGCGATALKIDTAVIDAIGEDPDGEVTARAIIDAAHELGLTVTAEGVETTDQFAFLEAHGCDGVQGYLMSRPLDADALGRFLRSHGDRPASG